ncbi:MAG: hypothetical protein ACREUU_16020 [Gammaproteobacteria bacterium]
MAAVNDPNPRKSSAADAAVATECPDAQLAAVLESRFGDGMVYLPRNRPRYLFELAVNRGLIDAEGYLTRKGRTFLARHYYA